MKTKTKADYFLLLTELSQKKLLPTGKHFSRRNTDEYIKSLGFTFVSNDQPPRVITSIRNWYGEWYNSRNIAVNKDNPKQTEQQSDQDDSHIQSVNNDRRTRVLIFQRDEYKKKYEYLLNDVEKLEKEISAICAIRENVSFEPITPRHNKSVSESIAVAQLSDLHVGEVVDPNTINGLNKFNPEIADKRLFLYFQNLLSRITALRHDTKIDTLFLSLTGDNITGWIHEELMVGNAMSPFEEVRFAKRMLIRGIDFLLNHGKFKKIFIQTNFGNHGRTTKRIAYSMAYRTSYDYLLYCDLAEYFKNEQSIEFNISQGHICYSPPMFGKIIRTFHGDTFNYSGGIGGLSVPLIKYLHRMDNQQPADMNLIGHWHQRIRPIKNCLVNGSIIGINAFAQGIGCTPEPPQQNLILLDKRRGFTMEIPIFCD